MLNEIIKKEKQIAIIGLGYVGLPIALEFAKKVKVIGFDINAERVDMMKNSIDPSGELEASDFEGADILFTANPEDLKKASFFIVAVPTPIDEHKIPDLKPLLSATKTVGKALKKGDVVVFESTVYPGCTEEDCVPILENKSGLIFNKDFKVGFSPERINPGDKEHTITTIVKVVSGCCDESLELIAKVYELIVKAGVHKAPSIKVAEAAKVIENTQRDLNIAFMNELSVIFNKMGINTFDVIEAAKTKWNFLKFYPGLVGGHCIGVDPFYLTYKARQLGYTPKVILSGRQINDDMGIYIARQTTKLMSSAGKTLNKSKVLVLGATFKENVGDIRNSKVFDVVKELQDLNISVDIVDPFASSKEVEHEYGCKLTPEIGKDYDAIIYAVRHRAYRTFDEAYFESITSENAVFIDIKGEYKDKISKLKYWSL